MEMAHGTWCAKTPVECVIPCFFGDSELFTEGVLRVDLWIVYFKVIDMGTM